jgi:hypothetical protein
MASDRARLLWVVWSAALCLVLAVDYATAQCSGAKDGPQVQKSAIAQPVGGAPRWVCPNANLTIDPLWRGEQIACSFLIRNEGTAQLDIKARGG